MIKEAYRSLVNSLRKGDSIQYTARLIEQVRQKETLAVATRMYVCDGENKEEEIKRHEAYREEITRTFQEINNKRGFESITVDF